MYGLYRSVAIVTGIADHVDCGCPDYVHVALSSRVWAVHRRSCCEG